MSQLQENVQENVQDSYSFRRPAQVLSDNPTDEKLTASAISFVKYVQFSLFINK